MTKPIHMMDDLEVLSYYETIRPDFRKAVKTHMKNARKQELDIVVNQRLLQHDVHALIDALEEAGVISRADIRRKSLTKTMALIEVCELHAGEEKHDNDV